MGVRLPVTSMATGAPVPDAISVGVLEVDELVVAVVFDAADELTVAVLPVPDDEALLVVFAAVDDDKAEPEVELNEVWLPPEPEPAVFGFTSAAVADDGKDEGDEDALLPP